MVQEGLQDRQNAIRRRPALTASVIAVRGFLGSRTDGVGFRVHPLRPGGMLVTPAQNSFGGEIFDQHGAEFRQDGVDDGLLGIAFGARPFLRIECFEIVACYVADGVGACLDHPRSGSGAAALPTRAPSPAPANSRRPSPYPQRSGRRPTPARSSHRPTGRRSTGRSMCPCPRCG